MITVTRYHDFSAGHRVYGHESKCKHLHGHNYRIHFEVTGPELDQQGRIMDFSIIKERLCDWLEDNWDHKMLLWESDPISKTMSDYMDVSFDEEKSIILLSFNPTAENMAKYLVEIVGAAQLRGTGCVLIKCIVEETRKCSATFIHPEWAPRNRDNAEAQDQILYSAKSPEKKLSENDFIDLPF